MTDAGCGNTRWPKLPCRGDQMAECGGGGGTPRVAGRGRARRDGSAARPAGARLPGADRPAAAGDRVLLNATALELGLGTGGYALVVAIPERLPADPAGPGHLVKARYTPLQVTVLGADEQGSPHHETLRDADDLGGMPVVVADLHSAVPAVLAALRADRPGRHGGLRDAGRRGAAGLVLPDLRRPCGRPAGWPARSRSARRSAVTWRRSPCTPACSRRGTYWARELDRRRAGTGQSGHRHPVGVLGRRLRGGGQRGGRAGRPPGRQPADQRGRPARPPPRRSPTTA